MKPAPRHIDQQADKRLFVEAVRRTTHSIDLPLIAEMVEASHRAGRPAGFAGRIGFPERQSFPLRADFFGRLGKTVAGQIDEELPSASVK